MNYRSTNKAGDLRGCCAAQVHVFLVNGNWLTRREALQILRMKSSTLAWRAKRGLIDTKVVPNPNFVRRDGE